MFLQHNNLFLELILYIIIALFIFRSDFFAFLDKSEATRIKNIDGLRFFLAISVMFHHIIPCYNWVHGAGWTKGGQEFHDKLGNFGVSLFFMISAYILSSKNILENTDFIKFYINRFFRIAPMFWVSSFLCLSAAFILGGSLDTHNIFIKLLMWSDAGITPYKPDINSFHNAKLVNSGVMWTLPWEWLLYFCLPIILVARHSIYPFFVTIFLMLCSTFFITDQHYAYYVYSMSFCFGFMARDLRGTIRFSNTVKSALILMALFVVFDSKYDPFLIQNQFFEFIAFFLICEGGDIFGLLTMKPVIRLGEISYSIYLLHGVFLFWANETFLYFPQTFYLYCITLLLGMIATLFAACFCFVFVEQKGMNAGRKICRKIAG